VEGTIKSIIFQPLLEISPKLNNYIFDKQIKKKSMIMVIVINLVIFKGK